MSEAEVLERDPVSGQYLPGHSGGPGRGHLSRPTGKPFLESITQAWLKHGDSVIERVVMDDPAIFLRICASLVPKELLIRQLNNTQHMKRHELEARIAALEAKLETQSD